MDLNRADATLIQEDERQQMLAEFGIAHAQPLAVGTEAEVYERDETTLLKLYANAGRLAHLQTLQKLYDSLNTMPSGLVLPRIQQIVRRGNLLAVLESRLAGEPLADFLPGLAGEALERAETLYLEAVWRLRQIEIPSQPQNYLLFDETGYSETAVQSFETFYAGFLAQKIERVGTVFSSLDPAFAAKAAALVAAIRTAPAVPLALVHGDFFPGNVLVDKALTQVTGVIDFGSFTLFGNPLLDVAGAFGFYKMYDPARKAIRQRLLPRILARLTEEEKPRFFQFLLAHALLTCDLYAPDDLHEDGHFQWAAEIVGDEGYWSEALSL